jgi:hypothetical protein
VESLRAHLLAAEKDALKNAMELAAATSQKPHDFLKLTAQISTKSCGGMA